MRSIPTYLDQCKNDGERLAWWERAVSLHRKRGELGLADFSQRKADQLRDKWATRPQEWK